MARLPVGLLLLLPHGVFAAGPPEAASRHHKTAIAASRAGHWPAAIEHWKAAEALDPSWKYAVNLASAHAATEQWLDAWDAAQRALARGVPDDKRASVDTLVAGIESELLRTHALIELTVEPSDATVERDDRAWVAPRRVWTSATASHLVVRKEGFVVVEELWSHAPGRRARRTVTLTALPTVGTLIVEGTPPGAFVTIRGEAAGVLPRVERRDLLAGPAVIRVEAPGPRSYEVSVVVRAGEAVTVGVDLAAPIVAPQPAVHRSTWPWVLAGVSVAAAGAAVGLYVHARQGASDLDALNAAPPNWATYSDQFDSTARRVRSETIAAYVLSATAGVFAAGALVLGLTPEGSPPVGGRF